MTLIIYISYIYHKYILSHIYIIYIGIVGVHNIDRIRILPPLDEVIYRGLLKISVAVLDPFPVGNYLAIRLYKYTYIITIL